MEKPQDRVFKASVLVSAQLAGDFGGGTSRRVPGRLIVLGRFARCQQFDIGAQ